MAGSSPACLVPCRAHLPLVAAQGCLRRCSATVGIMRPVYPEPAEGPPKTCRPATNHPAPPPRRAHHAAAHAPPGPLIRAGRPRPSPLGLRLRLRPKRLQALGVFGDLSRTSLHDPSGPRHLGAMRQERASGTRVLKAAVVGSRGRRQDAPQAEPFRRPTAIPLDPRPVRRLGGSYRFCVRKILIGIRIFRPLSGRFGVNRPRVVGRRVLGRHGLDGSRLRRRGAGRSGPRWRHEPSPPPPLAAVRRHRLTPRRRPSAPPPEPGRPLRGRIPGALLGQKRVHHIENLSLLASRQFRHLLEGMADSSARGSVALGLGSAKQLFDRNPQGACHRQEHFRAGQLVVVLPENDIGMLNSDLVGKFANREAGRLSQLTEAGNLFGSCHARTIPARGKRRLHLGSMLTKNGQRNKS